MDAKASAAIAALIGLGLGYFAGREHLKHEIQSTMGGIAESGSGIFGSGGGMALPVEIDFGQSFSGDDLELTIDRTWTEGELLAVEIRIKNNSPGKIVNVGGWLTPLSPILADEFENVFTAAEVRFLDAGDPPKIQPGEALRAVATFAIPPDAAQQLELTIDLGSLGRDQFTFCTFKIPRSAFAED